MSHTGKKRKGTGSADITVLIVRPTTPNCDALDHVYQIFARANTES